jgi:P-type Ca2+ transporter type 2B
MIMDSLASLALATELPTDALLARPPYRRNEYIISRKMVKHIVGQAFF